MRHRRADFACVSHRGLEPKVPVPASQNSSRRKHTPPHHTISSRAQCKSPQPRLSIHCIHPAGTGPQAVQSPDRTRPAENILRPTTPSHPGLNANPLKPRMSIHCVHPAGTGPQAVQSPVHGSPAFACIVPKSLKVSNPFINTINVLGIISCNKAAQQRVVCKLQTTETDCE